MLKIALVVHGRFHAFDLARELIAPKAEVTVLTNYPKRIVAKFGIPPERVRNCVLHGVAARVIHRIGGAKAQMRFEPHLHRWFSRWAAKILKGMRVDAIHAFSGISEEIFRGFQNHRPLCSLVRGSSHIRTQARLLSEEVTRCGHEMDRPSSWMVEREIREYQLADLVFVLSTFCYNSFLEEGFPREKLRLLVSGNQLSRFRPTPEIVAARCKRILTGETLKVLTVGTFSFRKGAFDLAKIAKKLHGRFAFRFVGDLPPETRQLQNTLTDRIEFIPRQPQFSLPQIYEWGDVFLFPTIEDGFASVQAQATASALPMLTTPNGAGVDLVQDGKNGWILPIRDSRAFIERLCWCDENRSLLAKMIQSTHEQFQPRDWSQVATDLLNNYHTWFEINNGRRSNVSL